MASTVIMMAMPGKVVIHHAWRRYARPPESIRPHSAVGGSAPSPRKERAAPAMIALATPNVAITTIGPSTLGNTWSMMIRQARAPL